MQGGPLDDEFLEKYFPIQEDKIEFKIENKIPPSFQVRFVQAEVQAKAGNFQTALAILDDIEKNAQSPLNPDMPDFAAIRAISRRVDSLRPDWKKQNRKNKTNILLVIIESLFLLLAICVVMYVLFAGEKDPLSPWHRGVLGKVITLLSFPLGFLPALSLFTGQAGSLDYWWYLLTQKFSKKSTAEKIYEIALWINGILCLWLLWMIFMK